MREAMYVMLLVVFYTGEAALGIGLRHSQIPKLSPPKTIETRGRLGLIGLRLTVGRQRSTDHRKL
ncbi:uncharacterized protein [Physcomitrium patens]|uniref:uncharacterized protein isoform X2 n=1 Tax=Physcomitrium patens TaxID=3218 RepID=UPI003CCD66FC